MKKILKLILSTIFIISLFVSSVYADTSAKQKKSNYGIQLSQIERMKSNIPKNQKKAFLNMSYNEKTERMINIGEKYKTGDRLSTADSNFVILYETEAEESVAKSAAIRTKSGKTRTSGVGAAIYKKKNGVKAVFYPQIWVSHPTWDTMSYRGDHTLEIWSGKSKLKKVTLKTYHTAYGLAGTSAGLFVVYDGAISSSFTSKKSTYSMDKTKKYSGAIVWKTFTYSTAIIKTTSSSFNINSADYNWYW